MQRCLVIAFAFLFCAFANAQTTPYWFGRPEIYLQGNNTARSQTIITQSLNEPSCTLKTDTAGRFVYLLIPYDSITNKDQWREVWRYNANGDTAFHTILLSKKPVADSTGKLPDEIVLFSKKVFRDSAGQIYLEKYSAGATLIQTWSKDSLLLHERIEEGLKKIDVSYTYDTDRTRKTKTVSHRGKLLFHVRYNNAGKVSVVRSGLNWRSQNLKPTFTWYSYNKQGSLKRMRTHAWRKEFRQHVKCSYTRDGRPLRMRGYIYNENMDAFSKAFAFRKPVKGKWIYDKKGRLLSYEGTSHILPLITYHTAENKYDVIRNYYNDSTNQVLTFVIDRYFVNMYSYTKKGNVSITTDYHRLSELDIPVNRLKSNLYVSGYYFKPYVTFAWDSVLQHNVFQEYHIAGKSHRDTFLYDENNRLIRKEKTVSKDSVHLSKTITTYTYNSKGQCITEEISCDTTTEKTSIRYVWNDKGICLVTDSLGMDGLHSYDSLSLNSRGDTAYRYISRSNKADGLYNEWISRYESGRVVEMSYLEDGVRVYRHTYTYNLDGLPLKHILTTRQGVDIVLEEWGYSQY